MQTVLDLRPCAAHHARLHRQARAILEHLEAGLTVTPHDAAHIWGCTRLAARILEIKQAGHQVTTWIETQPGGIRYACYRLEKRP